jgi:predicted metalloprotease
VDFKDSARLDTSQVQDVRGRRMGGRGLAVGGGGGLGVVGLLLYLLLGGGLGGGTGDVLSGLSAGVGDSEVRGASDLADRCKTGADADRYQDCRVVGVVNSVQAFWDDAFNGSGRTYEPSDTQLFTGGTTTGCGSASSAVGPFYCPADDTIYIDLGFYDDLRSRYGASSGAFAEAYVIAHEYGHHVQDLLGRTAGSRSTGPQSGSVRLELQADCYAGAWAGNAVKTQFIEQLTQEDVEAGLSAAAAVGDDRIQETAQGRVDPESFSHGTSAQRQKWFLTGYRSADPAACDTFTPRTV